MIWNCLLLLFYLKLIIMMNFYEVDNKHILILYCHFILFILLYRILYCNLRFRILTKHPYYQIKCYPLFWKTLILYNGLILLLFLLLYLNRLMYLLLLYNFHIHKYQRYNISFILLINPFPRNPLALELLFSKIYNHLLFLYIIS